MAAGSNLAFGFATNLPVSCSHMGALPPEIVRLDGTGAEDVSVPRRGSAAPLDAASSGVGGVATLLSGFTGDSLLLNFVAYQPGAVTDSAQLQAIAVEILAGQQLRGEVLL